MIITGRDEDRAAEVAAELGGDVGTAAFDLSEPATIAAGLAGIGSVDRLVLAALDRDLNSVADYDVEKAIRLVTLKLVGYTEVVHQLLGRLTPDASIVIFGGLAKLRPYPGSTTITTINHGVDGLVRTIGGRAAADPRERAAPRDRGRHPVLGSRRPRRSRRRRRRPPPGGWSQMRDVTDAAVFLLENPSMHGTEIRIDGGWHLT